MSDQSRPAPAEIVARVSELVPRLREQAARAERERRLPDEAVALLADAGVFKLRTPQRYGGYEAGARTLVEVATELGRADGSLAWTASVYWIPTWMASLFPQAVQDEVFATPDARVCGTLSPSATATATDGGIVVNGKWGFISGAHHAHWQEIIAVQFAEGQEPMPVMALVPMGDLTVVDDWHTAGMRGTGSVSTVAENLFVPAERVLPLPLVLEGQHTASGNADRPIYRNPLLPVAAASSVGTMVGLAKGARDAFFERLPDRKITYTGYESQHTAPRTHLQVAEADMLIREAEFHAHRLAAMVDDHGREGTPWTLDERAQARAELGAAVRRAHEAVNIYAGASGGSSIYDDVAIQRYFRDTQVVSLHALMHPDTNAELHGRILCGLEPDTLYI